MKMFYIGTNMLALIVMYHDPVRNSVDPQETVRHWRYMFWPVVVVGFVVTAIGSAHSNYMYGGGFSVIEACWNEGAEPNVIMLNGGNKRRMSATFTGSATRYKDAVDRTVVASIDFYESAFRGCQRAFPASGCWPSVSSPCCGSSSTRWPPIWSSAF